MTSNASYVGHQKLVEFLVGSEGFSTDVALARVLVDKAIGILYERGTTELNEDAVKCMLVNFFGTVFSKWGRKSFRLEVG